MTSDQSGSVPEIIFQKKLILFGPRSGVGPDLGPNCMTSDQSDSVLNEFFEKVDFVGSRSGVGPDLDPNCMTLNQSDSVPERIFRKS